MAKASQVVLMENEFYLIKAPNGKVLEVKNFNTENGAAIRLWDYAGHPWQQWQFVDAGEGRWRIQNRFTGKFIDLALGGVVEGTDCAVTMKETKDGAWKVSVRTGARVNATRACSFLGGGGHRAASGCLIEHADYETARAMILNAIAEAVAEEA